MATVTHEFRVCRDCLLALANGTDEHADPIVPAPLAELEGFDLAPACVEFPGPTPDLPYCADFENGRCDGCGTTDAGERHNVVAFDHP